MRYKISLPLSIIVGVMIILLALLSIPSLIKSIVTYILIGVFVSGGIIGWEKRRNVIIALIILWGGIVTAIIITLL